VFSKIGDKEILTDELFAKSNTIFAYEIAMIRISPTEMNISSWLFHLAAKKQIIYK